VSDSKWFNIVVRDTLKFRCFIRPPANNIEMRVPGNDGRGENLIASLGKIKINVI
jgi:hypothetical protein